MATPYNQRLPWRDMRQLGFRDSGPKALWVTALAQPPGELSLCGDDWGEDYSLILAVKVETDSLDWCMWICPDDSFDTTDIRTQHIASHRMTDANISVNRIYTSSVLYIKYLDNTGGGSVADIHVTGEKRVH